MCLRSIREPQPEKTPCCKMKKELIKSTGICHVLCNIFFQTHPETDFFLFFSLSFFLSHSRFQLVKHSRPQAHACTLSDASSHLFNIFFICALDGWCNTAWELLFLGLRALFRSSGTALCVDHFSKSSSDILPKAIISIIL